MPPKRKPAASAGLKTTGEVVIADVTPPAVKNKAIKPFFLDVHDGYVVSYYAEGGLDYAEVVVHVNGVIAPNACRFKLHPDGMAVTWTRAIHQICFAKEHLRAIMGMEYSLTHNRVTAYDNVTEAMNKAKATPDASQLYWGDPQVIPLKFKSTGIPKITRVRYPTTECEIRKGKAHQQFNSIYYCRVQLAEQRSSSMATVDCQVVDLFDIPSSQGSNSPSLGPRHSKRAHREFHRGNAVDDENNDDEDDGVVYGGGGGGGGWGGGGEVAKANRFK